MEIRKILQTWSSSAFHYPLWGTIVVPDDVGLKPWFNNTFVSHHRNTSADPVDQRKLCWNQFETQWRPSRGGKMTIPRRNFCAFGKIRAVRPTELETVQNATFSSNPGQHGPHLSSHQSSFSGGKSKGDLNPPMYCNPCGPRLSEKVLDPFNHILSIS